jgi:hypothetical protein
MTTHTRVIEAVGSEDFKAMKADMEKDGEIFVSSTLLENGKILIKYGIDTGLTVEGVHEYGKQVGTDIAQENIDEMITNMFFEGQSEDDLAGELATIESEHFRQFSPFEFFAKDINDSLDPDGLWESYDNGVYKGVSAVVEAKKKEVLGYRYVEAGDD